MGTCRHAAHALSGVNRRVLAVVRTLDGGLYACKVPGAILVDEPHVA